MFYSYDFSVLTDKSEKELTILWVIEFTVTFLNCCQIACNVYVKLIASNRYNHNHIYINKTNCVRSGIEKNTFLKVIIFCFARNLMLQLPEVMGPQFDIQVGEGWCWINFFFADGLFIFNCWKLCLFFICTIIF